MGNKIEVDATLTFDPEGHFQGHKAFYVPLHYWPTIADGNA